MLLIGSSMRMNIDWWVSIFNDIEKDKGVIFFIDTPGDTDKIFLINLQLAKVHQIKNIVFAVTSSEIAAMFLDVGETAYYVLSVPRSYTRVKIYPMLISGKFLN